MITYRITTTDRFPGKYLVGNTGQGVRGADLAVDGENGLIGYLRAWVTLPADNDVEVRGEFVSLVSGAMPIEVNEDGSIYATAAFEMLVQPYFDGVLTGNPVTVAWVADAGGSISGAAVGLPGVASGGMVSSGINAPPGNKTFYTPVLKNNGGEVWANISGIKVNVYDPVNGALVVQVTGLSSNSLGVVTVTHPLILEADYAFEPDLTSAGCGRRLLIARAS